MDGGPVPPQAAAPVLAALYRYPVKGFSGQSLAEAALQPGRGIALDRCLGIANGHAVIPGEGWAPCQGFVRMTRNEGLPAYRLSLEEQGDGARLTLASPGGEQAVIDVAAPATWDAANRTIASWFPRGALDVPRFARRQGGLGWWDFDDAPLSLINQETVRALSRKAGMELDPLRFRGNLYLDGLPAWREFAWVGRRVRIGAEVELEILRPIERCKATSIDPTRARADLNLPALLAGGEGHIYCGVYARVLRAGRVHAGDAITLADTAGPALAAPPADAAHPLAPPPAQWPRYAQVVGRVRESAEVDSFWLRDPLARLRPAPLPGQHLRVGLPAPDARPYWRSYTISAVEDGLLRLSIKNESERDAVSRQLHAGLREGAQLLISGPHGGFHLGPPDLRPLVLATAGIGITPAVAMLRALAAREDRGRPVRVLHVARDAQSLALWNEVRELVDALPEARARLFLSRGDGARPALRAEAGRPGADAFAGLSADAQVYVCGPTGFMADVRRWAQDAGVSPDAVHGEVFASPSATQQARRPAPVDGPLSVCFDGTDVRATWRRQDGTLLELAEAQGLNPPANCRAGVCGACRQTLRAGQVAHLLDPPFPLGPREVLTCCAVPVSDVAIGP